MCIATDDLLPEEDPSDNESPEVDTDMGDDAYRVSDSEIIEFEAESQDDCLDAVFCQLINLYLRVGVLCQRGVGQWVLKSLNSVANAPEEVQNASVVVVEVPYTHHHTPCSSPATLAMLLACASHRLHRAGCEQQLYLRSLQPAAALGC